jgi:hypothetical protein
MRPALKFHGFLLGGIIFFSTCSPTPGIDNLVKDMVVQTSYDNATNFSSYTTYTMPLDTIGQIYNVYPNDTIITGDYAELISHTVKNNMDQAGYTRVAKNLNPDWAVNVYVIRNYNIYQTIIYPNFNYGRYGYYYPGYYGYSGYYYYPYIGVSANNSATLVVEIVDLKNKDSAGRVRVIWAANMGDVLTSSDSYQKSVEGIDQAFVQSAYLRK